MITNKEIEEFDEMKCYFFIDMVGGILWRSSHDAAHGRCEITREMQEDLQLLSEKQQYCVQQLTNRDLYDYYKEKKSKNSYRFLFSEAEKQKWSYSRLWFHRSKLDLIRL